jgi:Flp pilus assembly protein TadG
MSSRISHRTSRQLGQSLVEFALVLPIFLAILIGMVDIGRAVWANNAVANAAREAARWAVVHGGTPDTAVRPDRPSPRASTRPRS